MRRLSTLGAALVALAVVMGAVMSPAGAAPQRRAERASTAQRTDDGRVIVAKVSGLIDPVNADFVTRSVDDAERSGAVALVLQLNSTGSVVSDEDLAKVARAIHDSTVPVTAWVGPSGSRALGGAAQLAGVAERIGIAPGARLGKTADLVVPKSDLSPAFRRSLSRLETGTVGSKEAKALGIAPRDAPVIGDLIIDLPGVHTKVVKVDGKPRRQPTTTAVFTKLSVQDQLFHTVASPSVAYLLFIMGLALIVFELFTAGVGVAGLVGAGGFVLACYGLAVLPTRPWAAIVLVVALFGFAVDVQTGVPRFWSTVGVIGLIVGSLRLYDGQSLSWITLLVGVVGVSLFMIGGMPAMVRTRFSTPTIGREWMIGDLGEAVNDVDPDGVIRLRGALWRARTNRATPIKAGDAVRVVEVEGLLLEVEPETGGAVDYRERRRRGGGDADAVVDAVDNASEDDPSPTSSTSH